MKTLPQKQIKFTINENEYTADFPNTRGYMLLQAKKLDVQSNYGELVSVNTESALQSRYRADMIAFFLVCCPKVAKDLKTEAFGDLDMMDSKKMLNVYLKTILPWLTEWEIVLNASDEDENLENKSA